MSFSDQNSLKTRMDNALSGSKHSFKRAFCGSYITGLSALAAFLLPFAAVAQASQEPASRFWITPGAVSYHFKNRDQFNQTHPGLGIEYHFAPDWAVVGGTYKNSNSLWSKYGGVNWTPLRLGPLHLGATAQVANNYKAARDGKPFAFAAPVIALEGERFGANLYVIPTIRNVTGAVALQFKFAL
jgi:hypothetical protein